MPVVTRMQRKTGILPHRSPIASVVFALVAYKECKASVKQQKKRNERRRPQAELKEDATFDEMWPVLVKVFATAEKRDNWNDAVKHVVKWCPNITTLRDQEFRYQMYHEIPTISLRTHRFIRLWETYASVIRKGYH